MSLSGDVARALTALGCEALREDLAPEAREAAAGRWSELWHVAGAPERPETGAVLPILWGRLRTGAYCGPPEPINPAAPADNEELPE
ncbi:MAG: hypothetical protein AB7T09_07265 [Planctomycetota bacterium]